MPVLIVMSMLVAAAQSAFSTASANAYVQTQNWTALVRYAQGWTQAQPDNATAWYYLGTAYEIGLHQPANAIGPLQRAVTLKGDWALGWTAVGFASLDLKQYDAAARAFEKTVQYAPAKTNDWNNLASAYARAGHIALAVQALQRGERATGATASDADWYNRGNGYANLGQRDRAVAAYRQALRLNPRHANAWNNLGVAEQAAGNLANALDDYQKAEQLGDLMAGGNLANLVAASVQSPRSGNGTTNSPQRILEGVRQGQAHAWEINHPGQLSNPYGRP